MEQGLCNGPASVRPFVCPPDVCLSYRSTTVTAVIGFAAERPAGRISIDSCGRRAAGAGAAAQQQMRVASCREPTKEAQRRLVWVRFGGDVRGGKCPAVGCGCTTDGRAGDATCGALRVPEVRRRSPDSDE